ncbi:hypothetical protein ACIQXF_17640 [Lysinibacillus sp. NPDC097231]|uniref:hypothetical protein n=1 Tax=Lysinibacillus sp. NPDC097231 TaxID=3364142 RepID=UPI0038095E14
MKITNFSQIQSNPVYTTKNDNKKKDSSAHLTETYSSTTKSSQIDNSLWNYTPHEVGKQANNKVSSMYLNNLATPNWDVIPTKGKQVPSQNELIEQIKALAMRTAKAANATHGNSDDSYAINRQIAILRAQYISPVSPDRQALHKQAMKAIKQFEAQEKEKAAPLGELSLVTYLNKIDLGIETNIAISSNGIIKPATNSLGGYDYEVVVGGDTLLASINGEWNYGLTPVEKQKKDEFYNLYWSFVDQAKIELKNLSDQQ